MESSHCINELACCSKTTSHFCVLREASMGIMNSILLLIESRILHHNQVVCRVVIKGYEQSAAHTTTCCCLKTDLKRTRGQRTKQIACIPYITEQTSTADWPFPKKIWPKGLHRSPAHLYKISMKVDCTNPFPL